MHLKGHPLRHVVAAQATPEESEGKGGCRGGLCERFKALPVESSVSQETAGGVGPVEAGDWEFIIDQLSLLYGSLFHAERIFVHHLSVCVVYGMRWWGKWKRNGNLGRR